MAAEGPAGRAFLRGRAGGGERDAIADRLDRISEQIARTPAKDLADAIRKLTYLAGMLEGIESEIAESLLADLNALPHHTG